MTKIERLNEMQSQVTELQKNIEIIKTEIANGIFTLEGFRNHDFVVNCKTENDANIFLAFLQGNGIMWDAESKLLRTNHWNNYEDKTCYSFDVSDGYLYFCHEKYYHDHGDTIITFNIEMLKSA